MFVRLGLIDEAKSNTTAAHDEELVRLVVGFIDSLLSLRDLVAFVVGVVARLRILVVGVAWDTGSWRMPLK